MTLFLFIVKYILNVYFEKGDEVKMVNLKDIQKEVMDNKVRHDFNTADVTREFCLLYGEDIEKRKIN